MKIYCEAKIQGADCKFKIILVEVKENSLKSFQSVRGILDKNGYQDFKLVDLKFSKIAKIISS